MLTGPGWQHVDNKYFYLNSDDAVVTGWLEDKNNWYYLYPENSDSHYQGEMAENTWVNGCYVDSDGEWVPNEDEGYIGDKLSNKVTNGAAVTVTYDESKVSDDDTESTSDKAKSAGYGIVNGIGQFSTSTKEGLNSLGEYLGLDYDRYPSGSDKTQRELNEEDIQRDIDSSNKLREEAPDKETFDTASKGTEGSLDAVSIALAANDVLQLGKAGANIINSGRAAGKTVTFNSMEPMENNFKGVSKTNWNSKELLDELANGGVKYNPDDLVAVTKTPDGKLVWLENGNSQAGLNHVMNHADDFAKKGIAKDEITDLVMTALNKGEIVGYQGKGTGRPIYKITFNGETQGVAITVGSNGFIVGANPKSLP